MTTKKSKNPIEVIRSGPIAYGLRDQSGLAASRLQHLERTCAPLKKILSAEHLSALKQHLHAFESVATPAEKWRALSQLDTFLATCHSQSKVVYPVSILSGQASAAASILTSELTVLKGIGDRRAESLRELGFYNLFDVLTYLPKDYIDLRAEKTIRMCQPGETVRISGEVTAITFQHYGRVRRATITIKDVTGALTLSFFRYRKAEIEQRFPKGSVVNVMGEIVMFKNRKQIVHPTTISRGHQDTPIQPIYPKRGTLSSFQLAQLVQKTLTFVDRYQSPHAALDTYVPAQLLPAFRAIHQPPQDLDEAALDTLRMQRSEAHHRLALDELVALQLTFQARRASVRQRSAKQMQPLRASVDDMFRQLTTFKPTDAQRKALDAIRVDLESVQPMLRLLQGDVGSGKTAVAGLAALWILSCGGQVAVMAPTEVLARQLKEHFSDWLAPLGFQTIMLTGQDKGKLRKEKCMRIRSHDAHVVVGTHALFSEDIVFAELDLIIVDEQHRFGVNQRHALFEQGVREEHSPHFLMMSATPIPRSLSMTVFGDLDLSILDERPPGRQYIETTVHDLNDTTAFEVTLAELIRAQEQAFVVYPLIDASEKLQLANATEASQNLINRFGEKHIRLLHGRLSSEEKQQIMADFAAHQFSVLVSTTVIEVGINIPNATCMIIQHAERFGLSQLHQLRGRVGRGHKKSQCLLFADRSKLSNDGYKRLSMMAKTNDGFKLAEVDMDIRGPGDFLGTRQSGLPFFRLADPRYHVHLIEQAQTLARTLSTTEQEAHLAHYTRRLALLDA